MADPRSEIAERYASAFFELAQEEGKVDVIERDLMGLREAYDGSADLRRLIHSPAFPAETKMEGLEAILQKAGADQMTINVVKLAAKNRRLAALPVLALTFKRLATEARGEVAAEVVSAHPLNDDQATELRAQLRASIGKDINLDARTDPDLLGGLIVKIGSRMIDSSLKTKLARLRARLKEA
ncbi:MAG: F0F1 ATP synthase subunit delta [Pseudomonadota bacterium]